MKWTGWLFLIVSWGVVAVGTAWCLFRVLTSRRHWTHPDEDIAELHHGEFGEKAPKDK
ncbi:MAG: hypothetical protein V1873_00740 [Verrucomicrobiota bacterium]